MSLFQRIKTPFGEMVDDSSVQPRNIALAVGAVLRERREELGFVRAYAQLLDLDADRIIDSYKAECAEIHARPDLSLPVALEARSLPGGPILLVGVILAAGGYGTWY